ncbi:MAG: hypothetical protein RIR16_258 [Actinomycetota bacterium]
MNNPLYFVEREFPVGIESLWQAWADAQQLEQWYSPTFLSVVPGSAVSETEVGGRWAIGVDVSANGFNAYFWGRYSEVKFQQKLVHTLCYSQDEAEFIARSDEAESHIIVLDFEDRGESSWVRFTQFGEMPAEQAEASREGMESYLDNLEKFLAKEL